MDPTTLRNRRGQRLDAAFHPAERNDVLAILGHGITANKDRPLVAGVAAELAKLGIPALRFSFAGNGDSEGRFEDATISAETDDLRAVLDACPANKRLIYIGHSMGGAVGALVAAKDKRIQILVSLAGMVHTDSFFYREFGDVTPGQGCMWDEPDCPLSPQAVDDAKAIGNTLDAAAHVTQPWLLLHGDADDVVPISDSRDILKFARVETKLIEFPGEAHMFSEPAYRPIAQAIADWEASHR